MKKSYLMGFLACAAVAMTACSNEDVNEPAAQGDAIEFGTYVGRDAQTRGAIYNEANLKNANGFGVFAFYTADKSWADAAAVTPNFMYNQQVAWNEGSSAWEYSPVKYWPNNTGDKVSFFAYAPYVPSKTWSTAGNTLAFEVKNDVTAQTDLLYCAAQLDKTKQNTTDKINFAFRHALSRIGLQVAYAKDATAVGSDKIDASTVIKVTKVELRKKGDGGVFYTTGDLDMVNSTADAAKWNPGTGVQKFTLEAANFETIANSVTNKLEKLNKDDSYVMIIPQNTEFEVYIEYTVTTTDANLTQTGGKSEIVNKIATVVQAINFETNKAYTLNLVLGMTSVKVSAEYADWVAGETTVNLPLNTTK